jgi:hypothetical protein
MYSVSRGRQGAHDVLMRKAPSNIKTKRMITAKSWLFALVFAIVVIVVGIKLRIRIILNEKIGADAPIFLRLVQTEVERYLIDKTI